MLKRTVLTPEFARNNWRQQRKRLISHPLAEPAEFLHLAQIVLRCLFDHALSPRTQQRLHSCERLPHRTRLVRERAE
jgi:hypothetical protein